jgi:hypothetical protein
MSRPFVDQLVRGWALWSILQPGKGHIVHRSRAEYQRKEGRYHFSGPTRRLSYSRAERAAERAKVHAERLRWEAKVKNNRWNLED